MQKLRTFWKLWCVTTERVGDWSSADILPTTRRVNFFRIFCGCLLWTPFSNCFWLILLLFRAIVDRSRYNVLFQLLLHAFKLNVALQIK